MRRKFSALSSIGLTIGLILGAVAIAPPSQAQTIPGANCTAFQILSETAAGSTVTINAGTNCDRVLFGNVPTGLTATNTTPTPQVTLNTGITETIAPGDAISLSLPTVANPTTFTVTFLNSTDPNNTSVNYNITFPGPADRIAVAGAPSPPSSLAVGASVTLTATIQDSAGNTIAGSSAAVTFSQTLGTGSVTGSTSANAVNGVATFSLTGGSDGLVELTFTSGSLQAGLAIFNVSGGGGGGGGGNSGGTSSGAAASAPVEVSLSLDLATSDASCTEGSAVTGFAGAWMTLPGADDCTSQTTPDANLLGWATTADFPVAIAQRQIDNGWGAYELFNEEGRMTAVFIPAGQATFVSGPNSLHPIWAS
jgi:hypothetical protein